MPPPSSSSLPTAASCRESCREKCRETREEIWRARGWWRSAIVGREENSDIKAIDKWREDEVVPAKMAGKVVA